MCKVVLTDPLNITNPELRGWDFISVHEDNVELGNGMLSFKIVNIPGISVRDFKDIVNERKTEVREAYITNSPSGRFNFEEPRRIQVWSDNGVWKRLDKKPFRALRLELSDSEISILGRTNVSREARLNILRKVESNFKREVENQIEVSDLNA